MGDADPPPLFSTLLSMVRLGLCCGTGLISPPVSQHPAESRPCKQRQFEKNGDLRADRRDRLLQVLSLPGWARIRLRFCSAFALQVGVLVSQDRVISFDASSQVSDSPDACPTRLRFFPCWFKTCLVHSTELHAPAADQVRLRFPREHVEPVVRGEAPACGEKLGRGPHERPGAGGARDRGQQRAPHL